MDLLNRIKEILNYDEETGIFTWKVKTCKKVVVGDKAGSSGSDGYVRIRVDGVLYQAHRLAWLYVYGEEPVNGLDHINRDKSDNRISNLRDVSSSVNSMNRGLQINNRSGYHGIIPTDNGKWKVYITVDKKTEYFGTHPTLDEAIEARKDAELLCGYGL